MAEGIAGRLDPPLSAKGRFTGKSKLVSTVLPLSGSPSQDSWVARPRISRRLPPCLTAQLARTKVKLV